MSLNSEIKSVLDPILEAHPNAYDGKEPEYLVFNYISSPEEFGDDDALSEVYLIQVHYFCPIWLDSLQRRRDIKAALKSLGGTYPRYQDVTDNAAETGRQHHLWEFEILRTAGDE